jgi:uncharacterized protein
MRGLSHLTIMTSSLASFYPKNWPVIPFHEGEVQVQKKNGVHHHVMSYAPRVIRPFLPDQHRAFYQAQPFLVIAARDARGLMWSTLLFGSDADDDSNKDTGATTTPVGFVTSPDPTRLLIQSQPLAGDALEGSLVPGSDIGLLGIEFATRRRNRVNGRLGTNTYNHPEGAQLEFVVDQSFGNCPQYIKPRDWWVPHDQKKKTNDTGASDSETCSTMTTTRPRHLTKDQIAHIESAESIFVATGYRGVGDDPRFGNDASHRGGTTGGFLKVAEIVMGNHNNTDQMESSSSLSNTNTTTVLMIPDYSGNNHYNTIGNLVLDSRMGVSIPLYESGGMIQLSGHADIDWDETAADIAFPGAKRIIVLTIDEVVELPPGSLPIRWSTDDSKQFQLQVGEKIRESADVTSFHFYPIEGDAPTLPVFQPGQYLPISLQVGPDQSIVRTYSLSGSNSNKQYYRISVKRDPFGIGSRFLHDHVHVGDIVNVQVPAGEFVYQPEPEAEAGISNRTIVLLSTGIGATPVLSMLHSFVETLDSTSAKKALWIHGARNGKHHPFKAEVNNLKKRAGEERLETHVVYSQPLESDDKSRNDFTVGRIDLGKVIQMIPDVDNADFYMCGTGAFMADMETQLMEKYGVKENRIHQETF